MPYIGYYPKGLCFAMHAPYPQIKRSKFLDMVLVANLQFATFGVGRLGIVSILGFLCILYIFLICIGKCASWGRCAYVLCK